MNGLRQVATKGVRWTGLAAGVNGLSDVARIVVLARFLSPSDYGLMAMVWIVIGLAQIYMDLGVSAAIIHHQNITSKQLSSLYWLNVFIGVTACALACLLAPGIASMFGEPRVATLLRVTALVFLVVPIGSQFEVLLQKQLSFELLARWDIASSLSGTIAAVILAVNGFGVWALLGSFLLSASVKTVLVSIVGFSRFRPTFHFQRSDLKGYLGFGLFQMGERSINYLAERLDQLLIGPFLGVEALGFYNFAMYLTMQPVSRINPILTKVAFPVFAKVQNDPPRLRRGYLRLVGLLTTINAPLLIGLAAVAELAIPIIFGAKWTPAIRLVQILCLVSLSRSIGNPIGSLQLAKGRADLGFWWNCLLFACSLPAIYLGARIHQAMGVAVALLILQICLNVPAYMLLVKPLIGKCARDYIGVTLKPVALATTMAVAIVATSGAGSSIPRIELARQIVFGGCMYLGLLWMLDRSAMAEFKDALFTAKPAVS